MYSNNQQKMNRRSVLRTGSMMGLAGFGLAGTASLAGAADFADEFTQAVNYRPGRGYVTGEKTTLKGIVIHWWDDPSKKTTHQGVVNFFAGGVGLGTSAHYVVSANRVTQLVKLEDTALHAGDYNANAESVGIECDPTMDAGTLDQVRGLIRKLQGRYGNLWVEGHKKFSPSTACPGTYESYIPEFKKIAAPNGSAPEPPAKTPTQSPIDGYWGTNTTQQLEQVLGVTSAEGVIKSQDQKWKADNPALTTGWEWVPADQATGSETLKVLQQKLGVSADGLINTETIRALQKHFNSPVTGWLEEASSCIKELQKALAKGAF